MSFSPSFQVQNRINDLKDENIDLSKCREIALNAQTKLYLKHNESMSCLTEESYNTAKTWIEFQKRMNKDAIILLSRINTSTLNCMPIEFVQNYTWPSWNKNLTKDESNKMQAYLNKTADCIYDVSIKITSTSKFVNMIFFFSLEKLDM